jgi:hypothetical protein
MAWDLEAPSVGTMEIHGLAKLVDQPGKVSRVKVCSASDDVVVLRSGLWVVVT